MVDGKKSPEDTRLAVSFLAGVAITVLVFSVFLGSFIANVPGVWNNLNFSALY